MSKYEVGDRVRVKEGLIVNERYDGGCKFVGEMAKRIGSTGTIKGLKRSIFYEYDDGYHLGEPWEDRYYIKFDDDDYYNFGCGYDYVYSNSMLEPLESTEECLLKRRLDELDTMLKDEENTMEKIENRIKEIKYVAKKTRECLRKLEEE